MSAREKRSANHEVALLSSMKHDNIVSFFRSFHGEHHTLAHRHSHTHAQMVAHTDCMHACCVETDKLYIVMEFCDGGDLMRRINQQRGLLLPEEQVR